MGFDMIWLFSIIIAIIINFALRGSIKNKDSIHCIMFGLEVTIIGILLYYTVYTSIFASEFANILPYFIAIYFITTGFMISLAGFIKGQIKP